MNDDNNKKGFFDYLKSWMPLSPLTGIGFPLIASLLGKGSGMFDE